MKYEVAFCFVISLVIIFLQLHSGSEPLLRRHRSVRPLVVDLSSKGTSEQDSQAAVSVNSW